MITLWVHWTHAQAWARYSAVYRFCSLSSSTESWPMDQAKSGSDDVCNCYIKLQMSRLH